MANSAVVLAGLVFLLASVGARAHVLLDWPALRTGLDTFFLLAASWAFLVLLLRRPLWAITLGVTYLLLLTNAQWSLYWPSLRLGIPMQDFLLADEVPANYSWDQAVLYLKTTGVMFALGLAARASWWTATPGAQRFFVVATFSAVGLNLLAAWLQGAVDLSLLSEGSGSAVVTGRAPGLLEDSGASTVYAAAVLAGMVFVAIHAQLTVLSRVLWSVAAVLGIAAGFATGGRVFFLSLLVATGISVWALVARAMPGTRSRAATIIVGLVGVMALIPLRLGTAVLTQPWPVLHDALFALDRARVIHVKVMARAFLDHPWLGTGFGMFYGNYFEHLDWALSTGGTVLDDPPASLYLMLLSELGLAGALMIVAGLAWVGVRLVRLTQSAERDKPDLWTAFAAGASVSLAVSFLVGIHIIFWSVPAVVILIALGGATESARSPRWFAPVWGTALAIVAASCITLWATAPRAPEFRWAERGTPQLPVSLVVPIWPAGLEGIWASSGAEFLFEGAPLEFHVERPAEFYPMTLTLQVFDRGGRQVATHEEVFEAPTGADPGRLIQVSFDNDVNSLCSTAITPEDYCSFRLVTTPEWTLDKQPVAVLYVTRNLR